MVQRFAVSVLALSLALGALPARAQLFGPSDEEKAAILGGNAAKLFGMYPRKGTIAVGSDADLVIWNNDETKVIDGSGGYSNADFSPYDGWSVTGWPDLVLSRGEVVVEAGRLTDAARPGRGRLAERGPSQRR